MFNRKFLTIIAVAVLIATLLLGGSSTVSAQEGRNPPPPQDVVVDPPPQDGGTTDQPPAQDGATQPPVQDAVTLPPAQDGEQLPPFEGKVKVKDKTKEDKDKTQKIKYKDRKEAAARAFKEGALNPLMVEAQTAAALIEGAPHYFSHPNYANSPLPTIEGSLKYVGNELIERAYASDYPVGLGQLAPVLVVLPQALPDGFLTSFQTWNQANQGSSPFPSAGNVFHAYVLRPTGNPDEFEVVFDSGLLEVPPLTDPTVSEIVTFGVANLAVQAGDRLAFYGQGIPLDTAGGSDILSYPAPNPPLQSTPPDNVSLITLGVGDFPIFNQVRTYSFGAQVIDPADLSGELVITGGMKKFVDPLPKFGSDIPIAVPDTTTYPDNPLTPDVDEGADYYVIELVEYTQQMHANLPPTTLRGYRQAGGQASYLGPAIIAHKDRPVRILFRNLLPTGLGGNLFIPVDSTVMGSGPTADGNMQAMMDPPMPPWDDPQNPACSGPNKDQLVAQGLCYSDTRATLHLHGGISPWISDGTPHQWITPYGENTGPNGGYPQGVSVRPVPDMGDSGNPADGEMTFFYTNQQSARLMFYHDHAWGITRLNVYAGEAAAYIITDNTETELVDAGLIPGPAALETIPLVIQDKTFVPNDAQLAWQDETWDTTRWGGEGNLWVPHVYSPAQNPGDASGVNNYGRWAYGPWFWPPTNSIDNPPIPNVYAGQDSQGNPECDPTATWCEPSMMPATPYISMGMESFNDTPVVNGIAYPTITLDPKVYRFRILNAANDRFFNLSLYQAIDAKGTLCNASNTSPVPESTGVACTEVALNPAEVEAALADPAGVFPTPLAGTEGPAWIAIGTEGGFLPAPTVVLNQPITWVTDPTVFNAGNVDQHSLLVAPAERHDVIVDFSQFAGQTLILYNDAPAAFPARDPRYDYYTGNADLRDTGGAPSTLPGYGPNTRTVMRIVILGADGNGGPNYVNQTLLTDLKNAFKSTNLGGRGVFENGQNPIIVGQKGVNNAYNDAYGTSFTNSEGLVQIHDTSLNFKTIEGLNLTMPLRGKMIQDEMGEAFEIEYGRMSGFLGVETPNPQAGQQNMILHPYVYPPDEIMDGIELPPGVDVTPIASADDGTQIWKITHNGVDTHPIHFHLYDVQLINRVGWDGIIRKPDANELGWKDTVRISPLEDTIVALRPIVPHIPTEWNGLPNSIRLLDPSLPEGQYLHHANTTLQETLGMPIWAFNPDGEPVDIINHYVNFGWEYVYHCHILSHEEMDMMHAQVVGVAPVAPGPVSAVRAGSGNSQRYNLTWYDNSKNETGTVIERRVAGSADPWTVVATIPSDRLNDGPNLGPRMYTDPLGNDKTLYEYQAYAINVVGDTWDYSNPAFNQIPPGGGWPTLTLSSNGNVPSPPSAVANPSNLAGSATVKTKKTANVTLVWQDNSNNETGFLIQRADDAAFSLGVVNATVGGNIATLSQTVARGKTFYFRVLAFNDTTQSGWSNTVSVTTP